MYGYKHLSRTVPSLAYLLSVACLINSKPIDKKLENYVYSIKVKNLLKYNLHRTPREFKSSTFKLLSLLLLIKLY